MLSLQGEHGLQGLALCCAVASEGTVNDSAAREMEALRVSTLTTQLQLQQGTSEATTREARWREKVNNERCCQPHRRPRATIVALTAHSREPDVGFNEPADAALLQTPAHGRQAVVVLADKLQATPGDPNLLASLTKVLCKTAELEDNVSQSRQRLAGTNNGLLVVGNPPHDNRRGSVP